MPLSNETVLQDLEAIIRRLRPETKAIHGTDRLRDDLGLDSLHSMELLSEVTEKYRMDVDLDQVQDIQTVDDVVRFVARARE